MLGTAAMLDGLCTRIEEELAEPVKTFVATGGLSADIVRYCKHDMLVDSNLILDGLLVIYQKNRVDGGK